MTDTTRTSSTLARMRCDHTPGLTPASCWECMEDGVTLPPQARRTHSGQTGVAGGTVALDNDCAVQAIVNALGVDYLDAAEALLSVGWVPGRGATRGLIAAAVATFGFRLQATSLTLAGAARDGGTFIVSGRRGRRGHAWVIEAGRHVNALGWDGPGRLNYLVFRGHGRLTRPTERL